MTQLCQLQNMIWGGSSNSWRNSARAEVWSAMGFPHGSGAVIGWSLSRWRTPWWCARWHAGRNAWRRSDSIDRRRECCCPVLTEFSSTWGLHSYGMVWNLIWHDIEIYIELWIALHLLCEYRQCSTTQTAQALCLYKLFAWVWNRIPCQFHG